MRTSLLPAAFGARVEIGEVPEAVTAPVIDLPWLQATQNEALLRIDHVGRFHVRHGREVTVDPADGVSAPTLEIWLHGTVAGLLLAQRRRFALHASTVRLGGRLVAVAGPRGTGKSTTVGLLAGRGHPMVTDDVTAIDADGDTLTVRPSGRHLRLWPAAATRLGYDPSDGEPVAPGSDKRSFAIPESTGTHRLGLVIALRTSPHVTKPVARPLNGAAAIPVLTADTYRPLLSRLHPALHLRWMAAIAAGVPVVQLDRPADGWSGEEVAAAIECVAAAVSG